MKQYFCSDSVNVSERHLRCFFGVNFVMSQIVVLRDVKRVDEYSRYIVYGYIRDFCKQCQWPDNPYFDIPLIISHWCILFIFYQREFFCKVGDGIEVNEHYNTVKAIHNDNNNHLAYGDVIINENTSIGIKKYVWTFVIIRCKTNMYGQDLSIGYIELDDDNNMKSEYYGITRKYYQGSTTTITYDVKSKEIAVSSDMSSRVCMEDVVCKSWKLVINLPNKHDCVSLMTFRTHES